MLRMSGSFSSESLFDFYRLLTNHINLLALSILLYIERGRERTIPPPPPPPTGQNNMLGPRREVCAYRTTNAVGAVILEFNELLFDNQLEHTCSLSVSLFKK